MAKFRNYLVGLLAMGAALVLSGCQKLILLHPQGPIAHDERDLLTTVLILMLIIVIPVIILTLWIAYQYRASNKKAKYDPSFTHSGKLELLMWTAPVVIIAILAVVTWTSTHRLDPYKPLVSNVKPINIQVVSLNWRWLFIYPDQKIATINFIEFPVKTPVNFMITSDAPMNSFVIQQLAGQIYSMAGMRTQLHLMADKSGDYRGLSVAFSGDGFANMTFTARVGSQEQFNQWVNQVKKSPKNLNWNSYSQLVPDSLDDSVQYFNLMDQNLFDQIIMKYMGPSMTTMSMKPVVKKLPEKIGTTNRNYNALIANPQQPSRKVKEEAQSESQ